jgi:hypothetical protein
VPHCYFPAKQGVHSIYNRPARWHSDMDPVIANGPRPTCDPSRTLGRVRTSAGRQSGSKAHGHDKRAPVGSLHAPRSFDGRYTRSSTNYDARRGQKACRFIVALAAGVPQRRLGGTLSTAVTATTHATGATKENRIGRSPSGYFEHSPADVFRGWGHTDRRASAWVPSRQLRSQYGQGTEDLRPGITRASDLASTSCPRYRRTPPRPAH